MNSSSKLSNIEQAISVSTLANFIYQLISSNIKQLWLKGEISNLKFNTNGNVYLSLKDKEAKINAIIMNSSNAIKKTQYLKDGLEIYALGRVSYYKKEGNITFFIDEIELIGEGYLKKIFDELKVKLQKEGLFDADKKKKIPLLPQRIGVITSPTGAAIQDILNIIKRRGPGIEIIIFPVSVQGDGAKEEIAEAINIANKYNDKLKLDVLLIARGGGSIEDLWCFNEEIVARAVFSSKIPTVSAVGHEIDYTICDYVADLRAPTPSAAAEILTPDRNQLRKHIDNLEIRLNFVFNRIIDYIRELLSDDIKQKLKRSMETIIFENMMQLDSLYTKLDNKFTTLLNSYKYKINNYLEKLNALNPTNILKRGYSITFNEKNEIITNENQVKNGEKIKTILYQGQIISTVNRS